MLHMLPELFLRHVPGHIAHEQSRTVLLIIAFLHFLFLWWDFRSSSLLCLFPPLFLFFRFFGFCIFCFLLLLLFDLLFNLDRFRLDCLLFGLVGVVEHVLHFGLVARLGKTEFYSQRPALVLSSIHLIDRFLSLLPRGKFDKAKASVLVVRVVQRHVERSDFSELLESLQQVLLSHIEHQVSHNDAALFHGGRFRLGLRIFDCRSCCCRCGHFNVLLCHLCDFRVLNSNFIN